jgi:hypothetical protein
MIDPNNTSWDPSRPVAIPRRPPGYETSLEGTANLPSTSTKNPKPPHFCGDDGSVKLDSSSTLNIKHEKPKMANELTQRISLLYNHGWEWLRFEGDAPEIRALALARRVQEALKRFKQDENLTTALSSLLRQISPSALHNMNDSLFTSGPVEEIAIHDIASQIVDIKKDIEVQRWFDQRPSENFSGLMGPDLEAYNGTLLDFGWPDCSSLFDLTHGEYWPHESLTSNSESVDYSQNECQHVSKLKLVRELIWTQILWTCDSTYEPLEAGLGKTHQLIEQLEETYHYESCDQQTRSIIHVVWKVLQEQLKENTMGGCETPISEIGQRLSWNETNDAPPQDSLATCVSYSGLVNGPPADTDRHSAVAEPAPMGLIYTLAVWTQAVTTLSVHIALTTPSRLWSLVRPYRFREC